MSHMPPTEGPVAQAPEGVVGADLGPQPAVARRPFITAARQSPRAVGTPRFGTGMSREGACAGSCVPTRIIEGRPAVKPPRFSLAGAMAFVAAVALNLAAFRALYDEPGEALLFDALPTVNILAL